MLPAPVTVRVLPLILPLPVLLPSMPNATGPPAEALALSVMVALGAKVIGEFGAVNVIVWSALLTTSVCCACWAALKLLSPAWLASMTMLPAPVTDRVLPLILPLPVLLPSMLNTTGPPAEALALRVTVSLGAKMIGEFGAVKVIVWSALLTSVCCACWAALKLLPPA
jgi:hypothetical protein